MTLANQYRAATAGAALFDVSDRALIEVTGRDRATFLHNFCTNDIKQLRPGAGCEAFLTNVKGRILGHMLVFAEESSLWIDSDSGTQSSLLQHLDRYIITEDVQLHDRTSQFSQFLMTGHRALEAVATALGFVASQPPLCGLCGMTVHVGFGLRRVPLSTASGFLMSVESAAKSDTVNRLHSERIDISDHDVLDVLRIEAVWPRYGVDITDEHLAQEAGRTAQAISFTKGCYLGQEPIARLDALGHTNRELRGIRFELPGEIAAGTVVLDAAGSQEVGKISSVAVHPLTNYTIALAMLKTAANAPGTRVQARTSAGELMGGEVYAAPILS